MFVAEKGVFLIESVPLQGCLRADSSGLSLTSCKFPTANLLWKWVSRHRLFNLGTNQCLGINTTNRHQPEVGVYECDVPLHSMWWRCRGNILYGVTHNRLLVKDSKVMVNKASLHEWRIYGAAGEAPCAYPYEGKSVTEGGYGMLRDAHSFLEDLSRNFWFTVS